MSRLYKIFKLIFVFSLIGLCIECAPSKKNTYYQKKKQASKVNTSQLGRNRYYFSPGYQKKLNKSFKKK